MTKRKMGLSRLWEVKADLEFRLIAGPVRLNDWTEERYEYERRRHKEIHRALLNCLNHAIGCEMRGVEWRENA